MICFEPDDYINDRYESQTRWIATLSDGRKVYQDDDRPGLSINSAWIRLGNFLKENQELKIVGMTIGFRDHIVNVGDNADGYFFCKSAFAGTGSNITIGMYLVGTLVGHTLNVKRYQIPEIILVEEEIRNPFEAGECLICPKYVLKNLDINQLPPKSTVQTLSILPS